MRRDSAIIVQSLETALSNCCNDITVKISNKARRLKGVPNSRVIDIIILSDVVWKTRKDRSDAFSDIRGVYMDTMRQLEEEKVFDEYALWERVSIILAKSKEEQDELERQRIEHEKAEEEYQKRVAVAEEEAKKRKRKERDEADWYYLNRLVFK